MGSLRIDWCLKCLIDELSSFFLLVIANSIITVLINVI